MLGKSNIKFTLKTMYFRVVRGLTTLFHIAYDCNTSEHIDQYSMYLLYIEYIYISIQYVYLFISNAIKM